MPEWLLCIVRIPVIGKAVMKIIERFYIIKEAKNRYKISELEKNEKEFNQNAIDHSQKILDKINEIRSDPNFYNCYGDINSLPEYSNLDSKLKVACLTILLQMQEVKPDDFGSYVFGKTRFIERDNINHNPYSEF